MRPTIKPESVFHVTVASNFARAFDKYSRQYDKTTIAESTFPDKFFVLSRHDLGIGIEKAQRLLAKLALQGDRLVVLEARLDPALLHPNLATGRGRYLDGPVLPVSDVHWVTSSGDLTLTSVEEVFATSLGCLKSQLLPYAALKPRTFSALPIALACQAKCRFCFSESSASLEQRAKLADVALAERWMRPAAAAGAERFVITGGGEPGLLTHESMLDLMAAGARYFPKVVLITNAVHLAKRATEQRSAMLSNYAAAGLSVLAISRHHDDPAHNAEIMGLDTGTEHVLETIRVLRDSCAISFRLRLICVLQKGGIETREDIARFLAWAEAQGADEVCFKELYVSTTLESAYHASPENVWSLANQVPLSVLTAVMPALGFERDGSLPWGAPLYQKTTATGRSFRVAAYTEPSLFWERANGIARSWNLMANGTCLVSLEDPSSSLDLPGAPARRVITVHPA
jgi:wyosine [tRNA(Phe)-imidazoG37] synthetase (radical SAM superfamily)